jgi:hypothetical protein
MFCDFSRDHLKIQFFADGFKPAPTTKKFEKMRLL